MQLYKETASKYYVDDLDTAMIPGTHLFNILKYLEEEKQITDNSKEFLQKKGLITLFRYAKKEISFYVFTVFAKVEQYERRRIAETPALEEQSRQKLLEKSLFAKSKQSILKEKYDLDFFIKECDFSKLIDIVCKIDNGTRLSEEEIVWISTKGDYPDSGYFTKKLKLAFHKNEANFYRKEYEQSKDVWFAVNASTHYRKCERSIDAESFLSKIDLSNIKNRKLKTAFCATYGGVKRDLDKWNEALMFGKQAHELTPEDFRPCTLIGAVYMETGDYALGQYWYAKALKRGYSEKSIDEELRVIFMRADKSKQEKFRAYLLSVDPVRYSWVNKKFKSQVQH